MEGRQKAVEYRVTALPSVSQRHGSPHAQLKDNAGNDSKEQSLSKTSVAFGVRRDTVCSCQSCQPAETEMRITFRAWCCLSSALRVRPGSRTLAAELPYLSHYLPRRPPRRPPRTSVCIHLCHLYVYINVCDVKFEPVSLHTTHGFIEQSSADLLECIPPFPWRDTAISLGPGSACRETFLPKALILWPGSDNGITLMLEFAQNSWMVFRFRLQSQDLSWVTTSKK